MSCMKLIFKKTCRLCQKHFLFILELPDNSDYVTSVFQCFTCLSFTVLCNSLYSPFCHILFLNIFCFNAISLAKRLSSGLSDSVLIFSSLLHGIIVIPIYNELHPQFTHTARVEI